MRAASGLIVIGAVAVAGAAHATPARLPTLGWTIDSDVAIRVARDRTIDGGDEDVVTTGTGLRLAVVRVAGACAPSGDAPAWAPPGWMRVASGTSARGYAPPVLALCRDLISGSLEARVEPAVIEGDDASAAGAVLDAIERAVRADDRPPRFDRVRAIAVFAHETGDHGPIAGTGHYYLAVRAMLPPRRLGPRAFAIAADVSLGRAGGGILGDARAGAGLIVAAGPLALAALAIGGVDRIAGGIAPMTGAYAGAQGYARLGVGATYALEAEASRSWGTGTAETRAELRALSGGADTVIAIGGFYQHWDDRAVLVGLSLGLSFSGP